MATRATIRIIPEKAKGQNDNTLSTEKYIYLYHHWDGYPSGVGRGYTESNGQEGDVEYGYVIDCANRTLTCYDLDYGCSPSIGMRLSNVT